MAENILNHAQFDQIAAALEADRGLPAGTLRAVAKQESGGDPNAVSNKNARGAFQFIPATAKAYNVDVANPWDSMRGAADYLGDNMKKYGKIEAALADYNGGPSQAAAVLKSGSPTFPETQNYVRRILKGIGNAVIPSANAAELPQAQPQAAPQVPLDELKAVAATKIKAARERGISDQAIIEGLIKTAPPAIAEAAARNLKNGVSPADIVSGMGGFHVAAPEKSLGEQTVEGAKNLGRGLVRGARDLIDGPAYLLAKASDKIGLTKGEGDRVSQINQDAENQYQAATPGSVAAGTGRVVGNVAPLMLTGGGSAASTAAAQVPKSLASRVASNAAVGAGYGAAGTRTNDDNLLANTVLGAATGGVAGTALQSVANRIAKPMGRTIGEAAPSLVQAAEQHGLPLSAANIAKSTDAGGLAAWLAKRVSNPTQQQIAAVDQAVANRVGEGVGVNGATAITSDLVNAAHPYAAFDQMTQGVQIPISRAHLQHQLAGALDKYRADSVTTSPAVLKEVDSIINKAAPVNGINPSFSPQQLQKWKSTLGGELESVSPEAKALLGRVRDVLDNTMTNRLTPEQRAAYDMANTQYRNKLAVERIVKSSNNSGDVTPSHVLQASKAVGRSGFASGNAPYQDLAETLARLYGKGIAPSSVTHGATVMDLLTAAGGLGSMGPAGIGAVGAKRIGEIGVRKALDSQNPAIRNALVGNTNLQRNIEQRSGSALAAALARLVTSNQN